MPEPRTSTATPPATAGMLLLECRLPPPPVAGAAPVPVPAAAEASVEAPMLGVAVVATMTLVAVIGVVWVQVMTTAMAVCLMTFILNVRGYSRWNRPVLVGVNCPVMENGLPVFMFVVVPVSRMVAVVVVVLAAVTGTNPVRLSPVALDGITE